MKKQLLLGSTALIVGALAVPNFAVAEEKLSLGVHGYKNEYFALGDVDDTATTNFGNTSHFSDGEIHFKGSTELDNGLTFGVHVELEAFASSDTIDEAYTWVTGDFGKVVIGSENLMPYTTFWGVTAPNVGVPINSGWISSWVPTAAGTTLGFTSPGLTTNVTLMNDAFGISYASPRFSGFQFTVGYAPTSGGEDNRANGDPTSGNTDQTLENHDIFEVGANFQESFNGVDIGFAVGWGQAAVNERAEALGADDPQQFKVGASLGFGGLSIAGSYANEYEGITTTSTSTTTLIGFSAETAGLAAVEGEAVTCTDFLTSDVECKSDETTALATSNEGQSWDIGASYSTGPWGVSATYFHGEEEGAPGGGDDEVDAFVGAVSYLIGPGIKTSLSGLYAKWEDEGGTESEGFMGIMGLSLSF